MAQILVLEDEFWSIDQAAKALAKFYGHSVVLTKTLENAVERFREYSFDIVLIDINLDNNSLPVLEQSGLMLVRSIREGVVDGAAFDIPIFIISGIADRSIRSDQGQKLSVKDACRMFGVDEDCIVEKPMQITELARKIGEIL